MLGILSFTSFGISPITMTRFALEIPLEILSLRGPDGITRLFPKPCSPLITIIEKSFWRGHVEDHHLAFPEGRCILKTVHEDTQILAPLN